MRLKASLAAWCCVAAGLCVGVSCLSLDAFLFAGEELSSYRLDSYTGERECDDYITLAGPIDTALVHRVSFASGAETIYGVLVHTAPVCDSSDTLILYLHGRSDHIDKYWPRTRILYDAGYDSLTGQGRYAVMIIDYRGFGMSTGESTEDGLYQDGAGALAFIRTRLGNPRVFVYSYSLGTLVGIKTALDDTAGRVYAIAGEAMLGSVSGIVSDVALINIPGSAVTTFTGSNIERAKQLRVPLLWLHGTNDETLSIETQGRPVWEEYGGGDGAAVIVEGAGHIVIPQTLSADYGVYKRIVAAFMRGEHRQNASLYTEFKP